LIFNKQHGSWLHRQTTTNSNELLCWKPNGGTTICSKKAVVRLSTKHWAATPVKKLLWPLFVYILFFFSWIRGRVLKIKNMKIHIVSTIGKTKCTYGSAIERTKGMLGSTNSS
jgi:hypothetical protein